MSNAIREHGLEHLTPQDRLALAEELWASVAVTHKAPRLTDAQQQGLLASLRHRELHPMTGSSWDEVHAHLRQQ